MVRQVADDDYDQQLLDDFQQHGWHLVAIASEDDEPSYVFSVGLFHTLGHPEICIFGLSQADVKGTIINTIGGLIQQGHEFADGEESSEILTSYPCQFRQVDSSHFREYFGYARWFYEGNNFPMLQCVWPDKSGNFPWQPEFDARLAWSQPVLALRPAWPFRDSGDTAVATTLPILENSEPILYVCRDQDGDWQFRNQPDSASTDDCLVSLKHLWEAHPGIADLSDLPKGWQAERSDVNHPWVRSPVSD